MDVNAISKNKDYLDTYSNNLDISQSSNSVASDENLVKSTMVTQSPKNEEISNQEQKKMKKDELDKALKKLNNFLKDEPVHARYSVHKDLGTIMIKIVEDVTDKVILELPSEKILNMVASMCKQVGLLDEKA